MKTLRFAENHSRKTVYKLPQTALDTFRIREELEAFPAFTVLKNKDNDILISNKATLFFKNSKTQAEQ